MIFGPTRIDDAEGTVLAHSVGLGDQGRLRKGRVLGPRDIEKLRAAGLDEVIVARLGPQDVHEDAAAEALAAAFCPDPEGQGLLLTSPFTGRVNLLAQGPGVAVLDVAAIEAVNRIHPMITIATVPAFQQMRDGGMVATIKIISYAVPRAALEAACRAARGALRLARPGLNTVRLVVTDIEGGPGDKGWKAIADRVAAFGLGLDAPVRVAHTTPALAQALCEGAADLTLILTGSATSDIDDVAPSAVTAAGGRVERFGMPVDPGNLLFIGQLPAGKVIGLPGCARAPALNGADWVLARVICGLDVTGDDIAAMGVGGLLKEIPSRPQPRRGRRDG